MKGATPSKFTRNVAKAGLRSRLRKYSCAETHAAHDPREGVRGLDASRVAEPLIQPRCENPAISEAYAEWVHDSEVYREYRFESCLRHQRPLRTSHGSLRNARHKPQAPRFPNMTHDHDGLNHSNIAGIHGIHEAGTVRLLAMELVSDARVFA